MALGVLTTACKIAEGTMDKKPIDVGKAIAQEAHNRLYHETRIVRMALACDEYLATEDSDVQSKLLRDIFNGYYTVSYDSEANVIRIATISSDLTYATFHTSGGLLRDGATWTTDEVYNLTFEPQGDKLEVYTTITEKSGKLINKFNFTLSDISYSIKDGLSYNVDGNMYIYESSADRVLDVTIDETLSFSTKVRATGNNFVLKGFYAGRMTALYTDTYHGYEDRVTMEYSDSKTIAISYLGEAGTVENYAWK